MEKKIEEKRKQKLLERQSKLEKTPDQLMQEFDSVIRNALPAKNPNIQAGLEALTGLAALAVTADIITRNTKCVDTLKQLKQYQNSPPICELSKSLLAKWKDIIKASQPALQQGAQ